ncbi:hypothetical protein PsYK624_157140 [Phanerochaete sordida]|uniref:Uncharacterized protein n=1 Tax=Phanerochaete sordida TaxID=48140 RepID=A0A9P3GTF5_9APHY|nr:hypothetical protein PsYK624_157140 [Phanerochaete sordida]
MARDRDRPATDSGDSSETENDASLDEGGEEDNGADIDAIIVDPNVRALLENPVPDELGSLASADDLRKALRDSQRHVVRIQEKLREIYVENLTLKGAAAKRRDREGGPCPPELMSVRDDVKRAAQKTVVCYDAWPSKSAFKATKRPRVDPLSPSRYASENGDSKAKQAEIFDALPDLEDERLVNLKRSMGRVSWIKKTWLSTAGVLRSHLVSDAKATLLHSLPVKYRHLAYVPTAQLKGHPDAIELGGAENEFYPQFMFPADHYGDNAFAFRGPMLVKIFRSIVCGKSSVSGQAGTAQASAPGNSTNADLWSIRGSLTPGMLLIAWIFAKYLLSGKAQFREVHWKSLYYDWKEDLINAWDTMQATRDWWKACVWGNHDPDVPELHGGAENSALTPAQRERQRMRADFRAGVSQADRASTSTSGPGPHTSSPPTSSAPARSTALGHTITAETGTASRSSHGSAPSHTPSSGHPANTPTARIPNVDALHDSELAQLGVGVASLNLARAEPPHDRRAERRDSGRVQSERDIDNMDGRTREERERARDRDRNLGRDHDRYYDRDHNRDYNRERERDYRGEHDQDRDRDFGGGRDGDYGGDRDRDRDYGDDCDRDRDYGGERDRERDYGGERDRDRDYGGEREHNREYDRNFGGEREAAHGHEHQEEADAAAAPPTGRQLRATKEVPLEVPPEVPLQAALATR